MSIIEIIFLLIFIIIVSICCAACIAFFYFKNEISKMFTEMGSISEDDIRKAKVQIRDLEANHKKHKNKVVNKNAVKPHNKNNAMKANPKLVVKPKEPNKQSNKDSPKAKVPVPQDKPKSQPHKDKSKESGGPKMTAKPVTTDKKKPAEKVVSDKVKAKSADKPKASKSKSAKEISGKRQRNLKSGKSMEVMGTNFGPPAPVESPSQTHIPTRRGTEEFVPGVGPLKSTIPSPSVENQKI